MSQLFKQSESTAARRYFYVHLVDATDLSTPETGESSGQTQISKNGASFASTTNTLTAIGNGTYYVALTAAELDTLGKIIVRYKSANTAEFQDVGEVVAYDPYDAADLGLTNLDATVSSRSTLTAQAVWDALTTALTTAGSIGKKLVDWSLGTDNKVLLSNNAQTGVTIPTVTSVTNDVGITQAGADKVWGTTARALTDKAGFSLSAAGIDSIWDETVTGHTTADSIGRFIWELHKIGKNKITVTATTMVVYDDDGATPLWSHALTDNGTTVTKGAGA